MRVHYVSAVTCAPALFSLMATGLDCAPLRFIVRRVHSSRKREEPEKVTPNFCLCLSHSLFVTFVLTVKQVSDFRGVYIVRGRLRLIVTITDCHAVYILPSFLPSTGILFALPGNCATSSVSAPTNVTRWFKFYFHL
jgi:hypothetical protein